MIYEIRGTDENTMFEEIFTVLDREHMRLVILDRDKLGTVARVTFTLSASSVKHKHLLAALIESDATDKVVAYRDEQED